MFTRTDARWLSDTIRAVYAATNLSELTAVGMQAVDRHFRLVASTCEECSYDVSHYVLYALKTESAIPRDYAAFIHDNPLGACVASGRARTMARLREMVSLADWQRTDHYNGIARPVGYNDQLLTLATDPHRFYTLGMYRDSVFSQAESDLIGLLQPHLNAAWHRVRLPAPRPSARGERSVVVLSANRRLRKIAPRQWELLRTYFPGWSGHSGSLPDPLDCWLASSMARLDQTPPPLPLYAFAIEGAYGRLTVRCFPGAEGDLSLFLTEMPHIPDYFQLRTAGLTPRECEVLYWIAQGKRDAEIATVIACAPATVSKHVENLLRKLDAENRTTAVAAAQRRLARFR